ncbi:MAG TPA: hypothetical protein VKP14_08830 [Gaiellaceae bacterium]|nr:hypothetical protein [Gaiellaceae bacterium]
MKTLLTLTVVALALAAVPVALGDDISPPSMIQTTPSGQAQTQGQHAGARLQLIRARVVMIERRFAKRCGTDSSKAPQQCVDFATKAAGRLGTIDTKLQALIAKRQQAGKNVDPLTKLDTAVQTLAQKLHDWLGS